jgi:hypothetical protein
MEVVKQQEIQKVTVSNVMINKLYNYFFQRPFGEVANLVKELSEDIKAQNSVPEKKE